MQVQLSITYLISFSENHACGFKQSNLLQTPSRMYHIAQACGNLSMVVTICLRFCWVFELIRLWEDHWTGNFPLKVSFPSLFRISRIHNTASLLLWLGRMMISLGISIS